MLQTSVFLNILGTLGYNIWYLVRVTEGFNSNIEKASWTIFVYLKDLSIDLLSLMNTLMIILQLKQIFDLKE